MPKKLLGPLVVILFCIWFPAVAEADWGKFQREAQAQQEGHYIDIWITIYMPYSPGHVGDVRSGFDNVMYAVEVDIKEEGNYECYVNINVDGQPAESWRVGPEWLAPCGGGELWTIIKEYRDGGPGYPPLTGFSPECTDFETSGGITAFNQTFTWSDVNDGWSGGSGHPPWGRFTSWPHLGNTKNSWGEGIITLQSGYRCPHGNHAVGGEGQSRHMWGDAIDMTVGGWGFAQWDALRQAAIGPGKFTWWECWGAPPNCTTSHLHVDRR